MNQEQSRRKRGVVINSDWLTSMGIAALLVLSVLHVAADFRRISRGHFVEHVSINTIVLALAAFLLIRSGVERLLRSGFLLIGLGASTRAAVFFLHASDNAQFLAAIVSFAFDIFGWMLILLFAVQWFRTVTRIEASSKSDG
jgi:hypothetical protein